MDIVELLKRNQGKHVWTGGLLEMAEKRPYRCIKCNLTMDELKQLHNTGVCNGKSI